MGERVRAVAGPLVLLVVTCIVFWGYLSGASAPPWDFWGSYTTSAYTWWTLGSFLSPPKILPFMLGGYPAYLDLQNASWFLPVGLTSLITSYAPQAAATLQAFTVAFGSIGAYLLGRSLGLRRSACVMVGLGYLFSEGFIGRAQHSDVVRAWAMLPWVLLALYPVKKPKPWQVVFAALLWFQFFVGAYAGILAASAYFCLVWVGLTIWLCRDRWRQYLTWLLVTVVPGALMAGVNWLPYLSAGGKPVFKGNSIDVTTAMLGTVIYPFLDFGIPNDITLRTFFIVSTLFLAIPFIRGQRRLVLFGSALALTGVILGIDLLGRPGWQESMPLLDLSRTRTNDFKAGLILGVCLLGGAGMQSLVLDSQRDISIRWWVKRSGVAAALVGALVVIGFTGPYSAANRGLGLLWLMIGMLALILAAFMVALVRKRHDPPSWRRTTLRVLPVLFLVTTTTTLGWWWARESSYVWSVPREQSELGRWGATADDLIEREGPTEYAKRPARSGPEFPTSPEGILSYNWAGSEYSRQPSIGGYANLKGQQRFEQLLAFAGDEEAKPLLDVLKEDSVAWRLPTGTTPSLNAIDCLVLGSCLEYGLEVVSWQPDRIELSIPPKAASRLVINELSYPGWKADVCVESACAEQEVPSGQDDVLISADMADSATSVVFRFETPRMKLALILFAAGLMLVLGGVVGTRHAPRSWLALMKEKLRREREPQGPGEK